VIAIDRDGMGGGDDDESGTDVLLGRATDSRC
jgi:hypothetical protein